MVGRMLAKPPPQQERSIASASKNAGDQEGNEGRSCLAIRFPMKRSDSSAASSQSGRRRNNASARSSVSSADQSDDTHALLSYQAPLHTWNYSTTGDNSKYLHNQSPTSTMDLPTGYSDSTQQQQQQHQTQNSVQSLLVPPVPTNRSPHDQQRRLRSGLYAGEVEPEGVRGQEAVVSHNNARPPRIPGAPNIRTSFQTSSRSAHMYGYPSAARQMDDSSGDISIPSRSSIDRPNTQLTRVLEEPPMQFSPESGQAVRWSGSRTPANQQLRFSDVESTASDDDIRHMMPDLLPTARQSYAPASTRSLPRAQSAVVTTESPGLSRAAQKAAAAAAAVSHARNPVPSNRSAEEKDLQCDLDRINALAMELVHIGDYERALAAFAQVLEIQRHTHGDVHPAVASAHHNLGTVHTKRAAILKEDSRSQRHCRSQALECFQAAARVARDSLGKNHPNVAVSLVRIGFLLLQSRQYGNAVVTFQEALRIRLLYYGSSHGLVANLYNNLGVCHMHLQEFEKGKEQLEQALVIQRQIVRENAEDSWVHQLELAETLFNTGGLCLEWIRRQGHHVGRAKDAIAMFQEALTIRSKILGPGDPSVVQVQSLMEMARSISTPSPPSRMIRSEESRGIANDNDRAPLTMNAVNGHYSDSSIGTQKRLYNQEHIASRSATYFHTDSEPKTNGEGMPSKNQRRQQSDAYQYTGKLEMPSKKSGKGNEYICNDRRIRIEPFFVPETSPIMSRRHNDTNDAIGEPFSEAEHFSTDKSFETPEKKMFGYDDEESFMLRDIGVDSFHGRIHYPKTWQNADMANALSESKIPGPDIIVTKPYRHETQGYTASSQTKEIKGRTSHYSLDGRVGATSTGNSDRDYVMTRARALLSAHHFKDSPQRDRDNAASNHFSPLRDSPGSRENETSRVITMQGSFDQDLMEDGVAPLGGYWPSRPVHKRQLTIEQLLADPINNLPAIHAEASRLLKSNHALDALNLFDAVLQCQRNKNGPLHPDVASALHNVGISQLRADSHADALKSFEEAARIRKGSLGSEHPLVAVSMVKVGICLLLMHHFDQALWTFREALSIRKRTLGPLHPSTARIYNNIGCVHVEFNEYQEARRAFEAALDVQRNALCHEPDSGSLMFGTATTLCNLGYLYRYRDLHAKACLVLKEAVDLQERVLGRSNATLLSTLDNLADSYANSGNATDALRTYNMIFERFRSGGDPSDSKKLARAEAVLLYKISRVHGQQNDRNSQLSSLQMAHQALSSVDEKGELYSLERRIQQDIRSCRDALEKTGKEW